MKKNDDSLKKFDFIDALRGWAILGVISVHSSMVGAVPDFIQPFIFGGSRGVQLFFIVSAFTLFYSLYSRKDTCKFRSFFIRRFFRIAPLFYIVACISILCGSADPGSYWAPEGVSLLGILSVFLFLNGWKPDILNAVVAGGWTIAVEMNFYLFIPILFLYINSFKRAFVLLIGGFCLGKIISNIFIFFYNDSYGGDLRYLLDNWESMNLFAQFYIFCFGILAFLLWYTYKEKLYSISYKYFNYGIYILILMLLIALYTSLRTGILAMILFMIVILAPFSNVWLFKNRLIILWGKISYSAYLLHFFIIDIIKKSLMIMNRGYFYFLFY